MATSAAAASGNLVADHMFMVTSVNAQAGTVNLQNPWGINGAWSGKEMSFSEPIGALASDNATFFATNCKSVYG